MSAAVIRGVSVLGAEYSSVTDVITADYDVGVEDKTILVDTTGGPVVVTLPLTPREGRYLEVKKVGVDSNNLTIGRNGELLDGEAADIVVSTSARFCYSLRYKDSSNGWQIV